MKPVPRIHGPEDDLRSHAPGDGPIPKEGDAGGGAVEDPLRPADGADDLLRPLDVVEGLFAGGGPHLHMLIGMVGQQVAPGHDVGGQLRIALHELTDHEEGGLHSVFVQHVQYLRGIPGADGGIEGEGHLPILSCHPPHPVVGKLVAEELGFPQ